MNGSRRVRIEELRYKEVINTRDGARLGSVDDLEIDVENACITALVVYGRLRLFGLLGREEDTVIAWEQIELVGDDTVLVRCDKAVRRERKREKSY